MWTLSGFAFKFCYVEANFCQWLFFHLENLMKDWLFLLFVWCSILFTTLCQLRVNCNSRCTYPYFPGVYFNSSTPSVLSKPISHEIYVTEINGKKGFNSVAISIINHLLKTLRKKKKCW